MSNTIASHWDLTNGSSKRTWRYMTNIYRPADHWWEYNHDVFITIERSTDKVYKWTYTVWDNGRAKTMGSAHTLAQAKRNALGIAQSRNVS